MDASRRGFLGACGVAGAAALAGCSGLLESAATGPPPVPEDRPDGVYLPSHSEEAAMVGTAEAGDYAVGAMYTFPHRFWTVSGDEVSETPVAADDDVHLMCVVWDRETGVVVPETGLSLEITGDGDLVSQEAIYPMLSQPMGFHYGANFGLEGAGAYEVVVSIGALPARTAGGFRGRFEEPVTVPVAFEYSDQQRDELGFEVHDDAGSPGAVRPREMGAMPTGRAPTVDALPGRVLGEATSNDARLVATLLEDPPAGVDGEGPYLAVSARTPYNRMVLPAMGLSVTVDRDGDTVHEGPLTRTVDPELHYHYGATVGGIERGDRLTVGVDTQPQTARHEGYETAFGGLLAVETTVE